MRQHHRLKALSVVATLLSLSLQTSLFAQSNVPSVPPVPPVRINFVVTDDKNHFVDGLRKEDIKVFADNDEQAIISFEWDERPIHYAITIDTSGSFKKLLAAELEAVGVLISNKRNTDEAFVARFISSD